MSPHPAVVCEGALTEGQLPTYVRCRVARGAVHFAACSGNCSPDSWHHAPHIVDRERMQVAQFIDGLVVSHSR